MLLCAIFCQWHMYRKKNIIVQIKHAFDNLKKKKHNIFAQSLHFASTPD